MSIFESIVIRLNAHLDTTSRSIESLTPCIAEAVQLFTESLADNKKIICCTSGDSQPAGRQFCNQLMHSSRLERPCLPALFLDTNNIESLIRNGNNHDIFARQIQTFAHEGDILFLISSSGDEKSLINALEAASAKKMHIVACTGGNFNDLPQRIPPSEVNIGVSGLSSSQTACIQFLIAQLLSTLIEQQLFGIPDL